MSKECILIKLNDGRIFFTKKKDYKYLIEFSQACGAELKLVNAANPILMEIKDLLVCICNQNYKPLITSYQVLEQKSSANKLVRQFRTGLSLRGTENKSQHIRNYLSKRFKTGEPVLIKDVVKHFAKHNLSSSTLYRYINFVKDQLLEEGKEVIRVGRGIYKIKD